jgi:hypothetical protein
MPVPPGAQAGLGPPMGVRGDQPHVAGRAFTGQPRGVATSSRVRRMVALTRRTPAGQKTSRVGCGSTDRDPLSAISDLVVPRSASTVSGSAYGIRCLTMSNAATGHRARDRSKPTASSGTRVGGDDETRASPPTTAVSRTKHGCGVLVVSGLTVPRTLSRHATCTYSCTRPPSRSRRSGRMVAPERRGVWPAGGC